jgi:hypothetical protein
MISYDSLNNYQIVTIAIAILGGDSDHIDKEDIALKAYELASNKFSWKKYPNMIDLGAVSDALRDAKKIKNGGLIIGNNVRGWMLSPSGVRFILSLKQVDSDVNYQLLNDIFREISSTINIERNRLIRTRAYELYINDKKDKITEQDFYQFLRINEYFKSKARERRFAIVNNAVNGNDPLSYLWIYLKHRFLKGGGR